MSDVRTPNSGEMLEFDLKALPDKKCRELERYVNSCIAKLRSQPKEK
jgi:hypothetical protein